MKRKHSYILKLALLASILILTNCSGKKSAEDQSAKDSSSDTKISDPDGVYTLRSDASIKKHPEAGAIVGNGGLIEFEYDGSKGSGLDYQIYYVDNNGSVHPIGGSNLENKGEGKFSREITIFNSSAHNCMGFMEITTVDNSGLDDQGKITGKNVSLGMYPIRIEVAE
jgi:hypothetical protein